MVFSKRRIGLAGVTLAVGLALSSGFAFAAEQRSAEDIINALKPPRVTRGLTTSPADAARAADETKFIGALRNRATRSLSTEERDKIASIASSKPKIDLEINFEFNSAVLGSKAMPQVAELGKALTSEDLKGRTFILAGSLVGVPVLARKSRTRSLAKCIGAYPPTSNSDPDGRKDTPHRSGQAGAGAEPRASRPALVR